MCKNDSAVRHIEDITYRGHEIVIAQCVDCNNFVVDARSDNFDGEFIAGWVNPSIYKAIEEAQKSIDKHVVEMALTVNIPF